MPQTSLPAPGRAPRRTSLLRLSIAAGVVLLAACATPPADERSAPAGTASAAAPAAVTANASAPATVAVAGTAGVKDTATITVYKSPTCGCCNDWIDHLKEHGFKVDARDVDDVQPVKTEMGVPARLGSCHTAVVGQYVVEGHVPADLISKMLRERPQIRGLAVPGMPVGSPGMEGDGSRRDRYDVIAIGRDGRTSVYATR